MPLTPRRDLRPIISPEGLVGRAGAAYFAGADLVTAANVALTLGMPLLLTGEPGCGKTEFAWAVHQALQGDGGLLECNVRSDSGARDLLYHYDALQRFGDAHHGDERGVALSRDARNYVTLLPLGIALTSPERRVVLIDEIDKAPRDLPNDLLRELDHRRFQIREIPPDASGEVRDASGARLTREMAAPPGAPAPFVLITSNVERQLPDPFLRRCVFFHIAFPDQRQLLAILESRFPGASLALDLAVEIFLELRAVDGLTKKPATSELIQWVEALSRVFDPAEAAPALRAFYRELERGDAAAAAPWRDLPALCCLLKLQEDRVRVGA